MTRKKVKAYVWTMRNGGLVQIGQTMYERITGKSWHVSHKLWLSKKGPVSFNVSFNSMDGAIEAPGGCPRMANHSF